MEEINNSPTEINSTGNTNQLLHTRIVFLNKKRKFQAEQLDFPLPKLKCWDRSFTSECSCSSNASSIVDDLFTCINEGKFDSGERDDELETRSTKDGNNFHENADSITSLSGEAKTDLDDPMTFSYDQPSTSSVNWGHDCFQTALYSLNSISVTKLSGDREKSPYIDREQKSLHPDLGLNTCLNYEEHLLEYSCPEYRSYSIEQSADKELEDMLYSTEVNANNYLLSSGLWNVNKEAQPGTKKLTIDKEFEYFSMLML